MPLGGLPWRKDVESEDPTKPDKRTAKDIEAEKKLKEAGKEPQVDPNAAPHVKVYQIVRQKHHQVKKLKKHYFPGIWGEIVSFIFAFLVAWAVIQLLGWMLGTPNPLVVVESESMLHHTGWETWYSSKGISTDGYNAINVGDIIVVKGDNPRDMQLGDVIIYTKYGSIIIGGEPVIHRVIGIVDISGSSVQTQGVISYENGSIITPCNPMSKYTLNEIRNLYSTDAVTKIFPGIDKNLDDFRIFITKGDNNAIEDQCRTANMISYPVHERLIQGRAKFDLPYVGYVKLGLVCAFRYATGNACNCRCWWSADHPNCCKTGA